ncbi:toll/interleukin-1 receptor domain-containing protein [Frankia sp. CNm7]|uniref:Toll/interleukin-1 receptor domain-containing protein n=1 Tax=Frankia nepalensis TaxID=1836974 RepID=A0A937RFN9_9ACTN|nr:toll/interleukin-1 receptor domain-containing protein [Frankia nepalensis]MBL7502084.1 toll/interleukin-1 receptor domain-containing protein [Frankia nepalensis]MBL7512683.1 toll/interleukin-1 receptor domain-containing protein [Frankia nepalensis]MBL7520851.1 toll/interleukin-1 receptor domain-containing protein [Frankia nepalensis]MBL7631326.1 toll/interleukin-1 receptor domain-containing protein [Frankia nepalensis]
MASARIFLSHSPYDDLPDGSLVARFRKDLRDQLELLGIDALYPPLDVARGDDEPSDLGRGLGSCQVFLPLYSSAYFSSPRCARQLGFFRWRIGTTVNTRGVVQEICWAPQRYIQLPYRTDGFQLFEPNYDISSERFLEQREYTQNGLFGLLRNDDDVLYRKVVRALADRIAKQYEDRIERFAGIEDPGRNNRQAKKAFEPIDPPRPRILVNHWSPEPGNGNLHCRATYVRKFREHLRVHLSVVGFPRGTVDLLDTADMAASLDDGGKDWRGPAAELLGACDVYMPLFSYNYFTSRDASKAWEFIRSGEGRVVVPVIWSPGRVLELMPEEVDYEYQPAARDEEKDYLDSGMFLLQANGGSAYPRALATIADDIASWIWKNRTRLRGLRPPAASALPAWPDCAEFFTPLPDSDGREQSMAGPDIRLALLAAARGALGANSFGTRHAGAAHRYYGDENLDWAPYADTQDDGLTTLPLVDVASYMVLEICKLPDVPVVDIAGPETAGGDATPSVVLVDAFLLGSATKMTALDNFMADRDYPVFVPENEADEDMPAITGNGAFKSAKQRHRMTPGKSNGEFHDWLETVLLLARANAGLGIIPSISPRGGGRR